MTKQTGGSIYLKKLFGFGLETKLSYTVLAEKNSPDYEYSSGYFANGGSKIEDEKARSNGEIALELSLPLFKSFKNSLASLQIKAAKDYIEQMEYSLNDTISQTIINVSLQYWTVLLAHKNVENLEILQKKIEERNESMDSLIRTGVRSKNDILAMQVNVNDAKIQYSKAKMELVTSLGLADSSLIGEPENSFSQIDLTSITPPNDSDLNDDFFAKIEEKRPDLKSLKKQVEAASKKVRMYQVDSPPDASLNFGIGTTGAAYSDDLGKTLSSGFKNIRGTNISGSLGVSANLGNNTKKGLQEQAQAEYRTSLNIYNKAKNILKLQILNAAEKLEIYKNLVSDADDVLHLQKNLYENEQKRFNAGVITVDNLLNQDQKYITAELSYYQVLINYIGDFFSIKIFLNSYNIFFCDSILSQKSSHFFVSHLYKFLV